MIPLLVGVAVGALAGLAFFGGLWLTVDRVATGTSSGLLLPLSLLVRLGGLAAVLVVVARTSPTMLLGAGGGLIAARVLVTARAARATARAAEDPGRPARDRHG
jgi:F1F0 ATPase subunit 2